MRFSALFQQSVPQQEAGPLEPVRENPPPLAVPELPDDLDARVRLVGEWQLLEG